LGPLPGTRKLKCPEIVELVDYNISPSKEFWDKFPQNPIPSSILTSVNVSELVKLVEENISELTECEVKRALTCAHFLTEGANSCQDIVLPACHSANAKSSLENGPEVTDEVANWVKKKYIAGPFKYPPLPMFRVNSLMAIVQPGKIRPVLNVSLPKNLSFNSNVLKCQLEKVKMTSAKKFSYSIVKAGKNAIMTKFDMVDAYKVVPAPLKDLRLQGFQWLNMYFVELRQIFGAKTAVANFDILGNTILTLTKAKCKIPAEFIHRTLDDVPFVAPVCSNWNNIFSMCYMNICERINVSLAKDCPLFDKAFKNSCFGKVLGINFDTKNVSWSLPTEKRNKCVNAIMACLQKDDISVNEFEKLMGRLNDISIMCPFLKCFKFPLFMCLKRAMENNDVVVLDNVARSDLQIWLRFCCDPEIWIPIAHEYSKHPLSYCYFTSDAAGCADNCDPNLRVGCGNVGFDQDGILIFAYQMFWPPEILNTARDLKLSKLGSKTTTLEFLGILLPFIVRPELVANKHVVVKVDNIGCFYGWINRKTSGDIMASILIRALHVISAYLSCIVHVEHLPRKSSWDATVADRLSREKTTLKCDVKMLSSFEFKPLPKCLWDWMRNPSEDWTLADKLLQCVMLKYKMD
jgi:hypothetical protein